MLSLVVGTSVIVFPQVGLPVAGVLAVGKGLNALRNGKKRSRAPAPSESLQDVTRPAPVTLTFKDVTCTLEGKTSTKTLLKGVSGQASPGRLLAILGPSGSGKTTLLNTLASQVPTNKHLTLSGELTINGKPATESNHRQAYVQQEDVFYSQLTVHETLTMAAELRLPPGTSAEGKRAYVDTLLATLGLTKVAGTRVGDAKRRGLSGGEKKRLSLGCELVGSPSLIFLDEPTSGLDAAAAQKVMSTLKTLAAEGHTVVCSIHQPRSSIWDMFDDLILLHEGSVVYEGPANEALAHFASLGHVCPPAYNPAEFLSDLISADYSATDNNNNGGEEGRSRVQQLVEAWERQPRVPSVEATATKGLADDVAIHEGVGVPPQPLVPWGQQFKLLARRSWRQVVRDKVTTISRIGANVSSAIVFGIIFWRMGCSQSAIQDRMGLMQVVAINTAMASLAKTLNVFPRERLIVNRERARNSYSTAAYLSGKLLAELPMGAVFPLLFGVLVYPVCGLNPRPARFANFLGVVTLASFASSAFGMVVGAFAPSTEAALAIGPAAMTVWIVFGGYYVNADNVPRALKWLPRASLIKQAFSALTVNEMDGTTFEPDAQGRGMTDGKQVLDWLSFGNTTVRSANIQQLRILAFYYMATYSVLKMNKPVFQRMLAPQPNTIVEASAVVPAPPPPAAKAQSTTPATATGAEQATTVP